MKLKWTTPEGYQAFTFGKALPENIMECLFYAESMIEYVTLKRIKPEELEPEVLDLVQKATYCQAKYYVETGLEMDMLSSGNLSSYQLGQMSVSFKEGNNSGIINPQAYRFLFMSGLMYRGVKQ